MSLLGRVIGWFVDSSPGFRGDRLAEFVGFFLAHAVWCVSDSETLAPFVAFEGAQGRSLVRFEASDLEKAVAEAKGALERNAEGAARAVLVYDGFYTGSDGVGRDALIAEAIDYEGSRRSLNLALPYRPPKAAGGFAVHRPKLLSNVAEEEFGAFTDALFRGADSHEKGGPIWSASLDQSA